MAPAPRLLIGNVAARAGAADDFGDFGGDIQKIHAAIGDSGSRPVSAASMSPSLASDASDSELIHKLAATRAAARALQAENRRLGRDNRRLAGVAAALRDAADGSAVLSERAPADGAADDVVGFNLDSGRSDELVLLQVRLPQRRARG